MSGPFNIGDVVVCVDASPRPSHDQRQIAALRQLKLGGMYKIRGFSRADGKPLLVGIVAAYEHLGYGWIAERFRHLPKADDQFTEQMRALKPIRTQVAA